MRPKRQLQLGLGAGRFKQSITVQQSSIATNAAGQDTETWSTYAARRAAVEALKAKELVAQYQRRALFPWFFRMRSDSLTRDIEPTWRISWDGRTLEIDSVQQRGDEVHVIATEDLIA